MEDILDNRLIFNATELAIYPPWTAKPEVHLPNWGEAVMFVTILFGGMFLTRRRSYRIFGSDRIPYKPILDRTPGDSPTETEMSDYNDGTVTGPDSYFGSDKHRPKSRSCCGLCTVTTPNSSRFRNHIHSRLFQKFPFLVEMFYWILNYLFYRLTTVLSNKIFAGEGIWHAAQSHAVSILALEQFSWLSFVFPAREVDVQQWFMNGHQDLLTFLDRFYSLIHIPGSMAFVVWYYYVAPSHATFATARRTLTLTNFMAFVTFIFFPVMPPRLLPKGYGFLDTVHMEDAASLWQSGKHVNSLAAMPSMHFGYAFVIGCTLIYHSGIFQTGFEKLDTRKALFWKVFYVSLGVLYPSMIFITIIATANHFFLDPLVAFFYCIVAFFCNKVFYVLLPLEDVFLWILRAEKPEPSTGERFRRTVMVGT